jgi:hypothetical protein
MSEFSPDRRRAAFESRIGFEDVIHIRILDNATSGGGMQYGVFAPTIKLSSTLPELPLEAICSKKRGVPEVTALTGRAGHSTQTRRHRNCCRAGSLVCRKTKGRSTRPVKNSYVLRRELLPGVRLRSGTNISEPLSSQYWYFLGWDSGGSTNRFKARIRVSNETSGSPYCVLFQAQGTFLGNLKLAMVLRSPKHKKHLK